MYLAKFFLCSSRDFGYPVFVFCLVFVFPRDRSILFPFDKRSLILFFENYRSTWTNPNLQGTMILRSQSAGSQNLEYKPRSMGWLKAVVDCSLWVRHSTSYLPYRGRFCSAIIRYVTVSPPAISQPRPWFAILMNLSKALPCPPPLPPQFPSLCVLVDPGSVVVACRVDRPSHGARSGISLLSTFCFFGGFFFCEKNTRKQQTNVLESVAKFCTKRGVWCVCPSYTISFCAFGNSKGERGKNM